MQPLLRFPKRTLPLLLALAPLGHLAVGQGLNYSPANAQNVAGTYVDLGTAGTVISTANFDDAMSAPQNIGFNFTFNGQPSAFSTFTLSTNGFLKLSSEPVSDPFLFFEYAQTEIVQNQAVFPGGPIASTDTRSMNIIAPFSTDLTSATTGGTEYRVATTGTAPNRVCTIQWKNVRDKPKQAAPTVATTIGTQYDSFSFQVKLYEANQQIEFVYGPSIAGAGPDAFRTVAVGIKGTSPAAGNVLMVDKNSGGAWAAAGFIDNYYVGGDPHNIRSTVRPDAGRTYRFRASVAQDATVQAIYTLGQVPVGTTHAVRASVRNNGFSSLTNLPVRLVVTGTTTYANTQTIGDLAPGATTVVTFTGYPVGTRLGNNTISVSVPPDAFPDADARTEIQTITTNTRNYGAATVVAANTGIFGFGTGAGITASRYNNPVSTSIQAVTNYFSPFSNSAGQTVYGVVANAAGTIVGTTPNYVVKPSDIGNTVTLSFPTAISLPSGDFFVGIAQPASTVAHYPVGALDETPTRTGTFYDAGIGGGTFFDRAAGNFGRFLIGAVMTNPVLSTTAAAAAAGPLLLWPNPASPATGVRLRLEATAPTATPITLTDALGRQVRQATLPAGQQEVSLPTAGLVPGLYLVQAGASRTQLVIH